jgi:hypothetical protein
MSSTFDPDRIPTEVWFRILEFLKKDYDYEHHTREDYDWDDDDEEYYHHYSGLVDFLRLDLVSRKWYGMVRRLGVGYLALTRRNAEKVQSMFQEFPELCPYIFLIEADASNSMNERRDQLAFGSKNPVDESLIACIQFLYQVASNLRRLELIRIPLPEEAVLLPKQIRTLELDGVCLFTMFRFPENSELNYLLVGGETSDVVSKCHYELRI